jgi:hypothetical protein
VDKILSTVELSYTITSLDIIEKEWYIYKLYSPLHAAYIRLLKGVELGSTVLQGIQAGVKRDIENITLLSTYAYSVWAPNSIRRTSDSKQPR